MRQNFLVILWLGALVTNSPRHHPVSNRDRRVDLLCRGESYKEELEARGFEVHLEERRFGISATMIRENPSKYWKYIAQPFRRQFTKKVLIMGSASNGKTTLAKDLARFYDAPVSLEYAREYQIKNNVRDDELTPKDYYYLLLGQYDQTSKLIDSSANRGLVIADTNSLVTKVITTTIWKLKARIPA